ncbi:hypothetical protein J1N35_013296 [Gossypium stocksii]|uniref:Uncharacterized protein n=1 Tax=Gossypium stocksii TaxID=47602 RepID=A0A9D3VSI4_9ROSI|nr:hypothetical protein J1N35_013296 [Gossypium stocksii]
MLLQQPHPTLSSLSSYLSPYSHTNKRLLPFTTFAADIHDIHAISAFPAGSPYVNAPNMSSFSLLKLPHSGQIQESLDPYHLQASLWGRVLILQLSLMLQFLFFCNSFSYL